MKRVGKKKRRKGDEAPEPTVLRLRDHLMLWGGMGAIILAGIGWLWYHQVTFHPSFQRKYQIGSAQMKQVDALEAEHKRLYPQLKAAAEESRKKFEALLAAEGPASPATAAQLAEANTLREALWTEELRYCRAIAAQMSPEHARRYLEPIEKKFAARHPDARGILNIPHP